MADKKELADLLSGLSEEELANLASIISKATTNKPRNNKQPVKKELEKNYKEKDKVRLSSRGETKSPRTTRIGCCNKI